MVNKLSNKNNYRVDTSRWYEDDDINIYLEVMINNEYGGYQENCNYLLANQLVEEVDGKKLNFIVATTPSVTNAPAERHAKYHGNNDGVPNDIDYYLNKQKQQPPDEGRKDHRKDAFDEVMPVLISNRVNNAKILFPYNKGDRHWCFAEIIIKKFENTYNADLYLHDPCGGGQIDPAKYNIIIKSIEQRIKDFDHSADFNFSNKLSPYSKRQSDGCSCGVITAEDLLKRIRGESLNIERPYPSGAIQLREKQLQEMQNYESNPIVLQKFITRNTSSGKSFFSFFSLFYGGSSDSITVSSNSINTSQKPYYSAKDNSPNLNSSKNIKHFSILPIFPPLILIYALEIIKNFFINRLFVAKTETAIKDNVEEKSVSNKSFSYANRYIKQKSTCTANEK